MRTAFPELNAYTQSGRARLSPATPDEVVLAFLSVIERCQLPKPFARQTQLTIDRWHPQRVESPELPMITWHIVHTTPSEQMPQRERFVQTVRGSEGPVQLYQQNFDHLVQFECYAATQEEASALEWWLVRQTYLYRYVLALAGAQGWRYVEAREDFMVRTATDQWPARPVRYSFTTAMVFPVARAPLVRINTALFTSHTPVEAEEVILRGEDALSSSSVDAILAVTSMDGTRMYAPQYDALTAQFIWAPDQVQPAIGESYRVRYLTYGTEAISAAVPAD